MKSKYFSVLFLFFFVSILHNKITVEQIWNFSCTRNGRTTVLKNSNQYTVLNFDRASKSMQIDLYDFATLKN
jgi:dipeptidyl-peptidase-4